MGLFQECVGLLISAPYPTVACLRGSAPAGGTVLGLCCDYRIAAKEEPLIMGLTEVFVGMAPPQWVHQLATNAIGHHKSKRVLMLGSQTLDPAQALKLGWIDETIVTKNRTDECPVPEWQDDVSKVLYGEALKHLEHYTSLPPIAQADVKRKANQSILDHITSQGLDEVVESIAGDEFQSTCNAILERLSKRK
ncbi:ClpP/crotonase-like domain-containing protein [Gorgonomyces haynaldii]|nr:ClpP/crotonase-like domain-containing protein [Gorgonomyces haynaldii]